MKILYYLKSRKKPKRLNSILEKEIFGMTTSVNDYIGQAVVRKDRENLERTKATAMEFLELGTPLVPKFEEKIDKFCTKYNMSRGQVIASILSDTVAASHFAKSANRQRTAEIAQLQYLKEVRKLNVKPLPSSGNESLRLRSGDLVKGTPKTVDSTKTIDAVCGNDYLFCKFTQGNGGAQDNQATDVIRFLDAAREYTAKHNDKLRFVAVLDGTYYDRHRFIFNDYQSERILVETSDSYRRHARRNAVVVYKGGPTGKGRTSGR
jgi:hypothetical protein